ncbi:hypothetical protein NC651_036139 [Populus alba x Populus x berolinensis]|nr:hypothetical protein NC651_036139 [Populus alba x Populus x berolinensis]
MRKRKFCCKNSAAKKLSATRRISPPNRSCWLFSSPRPCIPRPAWSVRVPPIVRQNLFLLLFRDVIFPSMFSHCYSQNFESRLLYVRAAFLLCCCEGLPPDVCFLLGQKVVCLPVIPYMALSWFPFAYVKAAYFFSGSFATRDRRTRGAKTLLLCNQSFALESLKDQLSFLMIIILGGDSLFHKTKTPTSIPATRKGHHTVELSKGYKKNLHDWLHPVKCKVEKLDWHVRVKITIGVARGLAWLHDFNNFMIVHLDICSRSILLDKYYVPKISNFGGAMHKRSNDKGLIASSKIGELEFIK